MGCMEGRMRILLKEWGVKSLFWGVISNRVGRNIKRV